MAVGYRFPRSLESSEPAKERAPLKAISQVEITCDGWRQWIGTVSAGFEGESPEELTTLYGTLDSTEDEVRELCDEWLALNQGKLADLVREQRRRELRGR